MHFPRPCGSTYLFMWEMVRGPTKTGRVASITYPSGLVLAYTYSDANGHHGIDGR
jgi:hypothetical protein